MMVHPLNGIQHTGGFISVCMKNPDFLLLLMANFYYLSFGDCKFATLSA